ncbi:hypothetical protein OROGR_007249 [Orobanche gracilis]
MHVLARIVYYVHAYAPFSMAPQQDKSGTVIKDENWYKATWAHRAWFATGCTTVLISLAKSLILLSTPRTWLEFTSAAQLAYLLADLVSGIYHWAVDNYGSAQTPIFGTQIEYFRAHHQHPSEITKCETAGIVYTLAAVTAAAVTPFNAFADDPVLLGFLGVFAGCSMFSIKFHAWAHLPRRSFPRWRRPFRTPEYSYGCRSTCPTNGRRTTALTAR